jgi:formamidopyrimidine-DNA glycosylase
MGGLSGLAGRRFEGFDRRGKQMMASMSAPAGRNPLILREPQDADLSRVGERGQNNGPDRVLGLHMGMTGRLGVMAPEDESFQYRRLALYLDDERRLELDDVRRWAMVRLEADAETFTAGMGPDALDPEFTAAEFAERVSARRSPIKSVLLDQKVLAGVGNIYADEALLIVGISPSRRADRVSAGRLETLHGTIVGVLKNALAFIESHPDNEGRPYVIDAQDDRMQITRKAGAPCPLCGGPQNAKKFGGRTAYYCPSCQH